ncbi:hypothetical protein ACWF76_17570 [Streptomyces globisporus]
MSEQPTPVASAHVTAPYGPLADALKIAAFGTVCAGPAPERRTHRGDATGLTLRTHDRETAVSITVPTATVTPRVTPRPLGAGRLLGFRRSANGVSPPYEP